MSLLSKLWYSSKIINKWTKKKLHKENIFGQKNSSLWTHGGSDSSNRTKHLTYKVATENSKREDIIIPGYKLTCALASSSSFSFLFLSFSRASCFIYNNNINNLQWNRPWSYETLSNRKCCFHYIFASSFRQLTERRIHHGVKLFWKTVERNFMERKYPGLRY